MSSEVYEDETELQEYVLDEFGELYDMKTVSDIFMASKALMEEKEESEESDGFLSEDEVEDVVIHLEEYKARFGMT